MSNPFQPTPPPPPPPKSPGERRARPRFDTMKIWDEATGALLANRDVLLAVLGVFVILPNFALQMLAPVPEPISGQLPAQWFARVGQYTDTYLIPMLAGMVLELFGMLIALALLGDPARPTVLQAMRQAVRVVPSFVAAVIISFFVAILTLAVPVTFAVLAGQQQLSTGIAFIAIVPTLYVLGRFSLIGPVVMLGGKRNPIVALRSSTNLTKGIGWQLLLFLLLVYFAFQIVGWLITAAVVLLTTLIAGAAGAALIGALIACFVQAALAATFVAVIVASYRQVGGATA